MAALQVLFGGFQQGAACRIQYQLCKPSADFLLGARCVESSDFLRLVKTDVNMHHMLDVEASPEEAKAQEIIMQPKVADELQSTLHLLPIYVLNACAFTCTHLCAFVRICACARCVCVCVCVCPTVLLKSKSDRLPIF